MNKGIIFLEKKFLVAAVVYFSINSVLLFRFGISLDGEAEKFIENANRILSGQPLFNGIFSYFYIACTLLVALFIKLSINLVFIALVQVIISFVAAICLSKLLTLCLGNNHIPFLFFIAYLLCYPIQKWNFFLYSESLHTSLLVIGIYYFNKWLVGQKFKQLVGLVLVILLILFSRPVGLLFLLTVFTVLIFWLHQNKKKKQLYILTGVCIATILAVLNSPFTAFINPDSIRRMEIICQVPETNKKIQYQEYNKEGLYTAFKVIKDEIGFGNFIKSGLKKIGYFFGMYRGYYSWHHNLLLICFTIFYPFALVGIFAKPGKLYYYPRLFALVYLVFTSLGIFFTCDEWSNRFISPAFPFILVLAAGGFLKVYKIIMPGHLESRYKE